MMIVVATCLSVTMVSVILVKSAITVKMASMVLAALAEMATHCMKAHAEPMVSAPQLIIFSSAKRVFSSLSI